MINKNKFYVSVLTWAAVLGVLYLTRHHNYLIFHALSEMLSVAVAVAIFLLVWNVRRSLDNPFLLFIGVAYLFIGCLDLVHTFSYHGMSLSDRYEANLQTQLWIAGRYMESLSFLMGSFFLGRRLKMELVLVGYVVTTSLILGTIFLWNVFPTCFVKGVGLTPFYEVSDFVIVLILAAAIAVLVKKRVQFDPEGLRYIVASIALTIFSQLCFAFFTDVYGMPYFLGHFFKLVSFYCIYKAIIELGLSKPFAVLFRNLKASEDALKKAKSELEQRVRERTSELVAANKKLAHEIEERRRVDAALELERNKFKSILEAMADCVYIANQDHGIEYANPAIEKEFGPAEGRKCYEYFHDRTESCPTCKNKGVFTGSSVQWEWYSPKTGKTYEVFDAPVPNVDGSISRLEILHDVTRRKNAEEALRESEVKHRIVADNTYNWEWWRDPEGNFIYNSPSCKRITQHELEEFAADPDLLFKIIHPEDRPAFNRHVKEVEHNDTVGEIEIRILLPDGSLRWLSHACQPVFDETGRLLGRRGSNRDITAQKSVDHALRESEKQLRYLSSRLLTVQETERRRIARELHDELGGALAVLKLKTRFIEKNLQPDQTAISEECRQNLTYIDQIIDDVHRLSRDLSPSILEDIGLTPALRWLIDNFVKHYGIKAAIDFENVDHLLSRNDQIMIYRTYQEALTNIGKHAQAVNVTVAARINEDRISFRVEDDGRGFDVGEFSKRTNSEKGLGLTAMNERAMMLGGEFHLWSEPGKGTRIALSIPITSGERI